MKKLKLSFVLLVIIVFNLGNSFAPTSQTVAASEPGTSEYNATPVTKNIESKQDLPEVHESKKMTELGTEHVAVVQKQMSQKLAEEQDSKYSVSDFAWNDAVYVTYKSQSSVGFVYTPAVQQTNLERVFLVTSYDPKIKMTFHYIVMKFNRNSESNVKQYKMTITLPNGAPIVGLDIDEGAQSIKKQEYNSPSSDTRGYWECVQTCLRDAWKKVQFPEWLKWTCSGGCGSCLFGPNAFSCAACAGCLGGYATGCLIVCR